MKDDKPTKPTPLTRSQIMSRIRSKWTTPEITIHNILKGNRIRHEMHPDFPGHPDVVLENGNVLVFIDGCFWHGCPKHYRIPKTNKGFWKKKIHDNRLRDRRIMRNLKKLGYRTMRIRECQIRAWMKSPKPCIGMILGKIKKTAFALLVCTTLLSAQPNLEPSPRWNTDDTIKECVFQGLLAVDIWQTLGFRWNGRKETNIVLGDYPTGQKVFAYGLACAGLHYVISRLLPNTWVRNAWQYTTIGIEANAVYYNWRINLSYIHNF